MEVSFLEPWVSVDPRAGAALEQELTREIREGHPLFGEVVRARARRGDGDDVLFALIRTGACAVVHLTWSGRAENPPWPMASMYPDVSSWAATGMVEDHRDFGGSE